MKQDEKLLDRATSRFRFYLENKNVSTTVTLC